MKNTLSIFILFAGLAGISLPVNGQAVWENHHSEVYNYLYRMAQKGLVVFDDNIRPLSRGYIEQCLDSLQSKIAHLSIVEKRELVFYRQELSDYKVLKTLWNTNTSQAVFLKKDTARRWRAFTASGKDFLLRIDPVISATTIQGTGKNVLQTSNGFKLYGYAGTHWGYYFSYNDVVERGTGIDTLRQFTPETGIVTRIASNHKSHNFSELRGGISYSWNNGSISFGQDYLLWGYGENGRIVLSDKAPAYPYIRFDYKPLPWLTFNYTHAWLNSNVLDSNSTYRTGGTTFGGIRQVYVPKFMATHSIQFTLKKGLDISLGESVIYSDKMEAGYLIPILFFKAYDNLINNGNINAGSNEQIFAQVSSRNNLPNTHLYGTFFVDEISINNIFNKQKSRNQFGFTAGGSVTDVFIPYLTLGLEYTRINPFVYRNLLPAQNYTNSGYSLGDWMGNNADRFIFTAKYTPLPRLKCLLRYQSIRKGGAGTLNQQYFQQPQPSFLFDFQNSQKEWFFQSSYEWINNLYVTGNISSLQLNDAVSGVTTRNNTISLGFVYGL